MFSRSKTSPGISLALAALILSLATARADEPSTPVPSAPVEDPFRATRAFCSMDGILDELRVTELRRERDEAIARARVAARERIPELSRVLHSISRSVGLDDAAREVIRDFETQYAGIRAEHAALRSDQLESRLTELSRFHHVRVRAALRDELLDAIASGTHRDRSSLREVGVSAGFGPILIVPLSWPRFASELDLTVLSRDGDRMRVRSEQDMSASVMAPTDNSTVVEVVLEDGRARLKVCNFGGFGFVGGGYGMGGYPGMIRMICASQNLSDGTLVGALSAEEAAREHPEVSEDLATASLAHNPFLEIEIRRGPKPALCRELEERDEEAAASRESSRTPAAAGAPAADTGTTEDPADAADSAAHVGR